MFTKTNGVLLPEGIIVRQADRANSQLIQKVREEELRDKTLEDVFIQSTKENLYNKRIRSNIQLCNALKEEKQRSLAGKTLLMRRRNNEEFRKLQKQLQAAYVAKAIAAQKVEREALILEEKTRLCRENRQLAKSRLLHDEYIKNVDEGKQKKATALKMELQHQIDVKNAKRQEEKVSLMKEKLVMDDTIARYKAEELQATRKGIEKKIRLKHDMDEFCRSQVKYKLLQSEAEEKNPISEELFTKSKQERKMFEQEKKDRQTRKNNISEEIGKQVQKITEEKLRSADLLTELLIDERHAKEEMQCLRDQQQKISKCISICHDLDCVLEEKQRQKLDQMKQDKDYYQQQMAFLAERDKVQRSSDEKKRNDILHHRQALQNALDEKKRFRAEEMKMLLIENKNEINDMRTKQRLIKLAHLRMLEEHAPRLLAFLPPRLLRQSDRTIL